MLEIAKEALSGWPCEEAWEVFELCFIDGLLHVPDEVENEWVTALLPLLEHWPDTLRCWTYRFVWQWMMEHPESSVWDVAKTFQASVLESFERYAPIIERIDRVECNVTAGKEYDVALREVEEKIPLHRVCSVRFSVDSDDYKELLHLLDKGYFQGLQSLDLFFSEMTMEQREELFLHPGWGKNIKTLQYSGALEQRSDVARHVRMFERAGFERVEHMRFYGMGDYDAQDCRAMLATPCFRGITSLALNTEGERWLDALSQGGLSDTLKNLALPYGLYLAQDKHDFDGFWQRCGGFLSSLEMSFDKGFFAGGRAERWEAPHLRRFIARFSGSEFDGRAFFGLEFLRGVEHLRVDGNANTWEQGSIFFEGVEFAFDALKTLYVGWTPQKLEALLFALGDPQGDAAPGLHGLSFYSGYYSGEKEYNVLSSRSKDALQHIVEERPLVRLLFRGWANTLEVFDASRESELDVRSLNLSPPLKGEQVWSFPEHLARILIATRWTGELHTDEQLEQIYGAVDYPSLVYVATGTMKLGERQVGFFMNAERFSMLTVLHGSPAKGVGSDCARVLLASGLLTPYGRWSWEKVLKQQEELSEAFGELRSLSRQTPSEENWEKVIRVIQRAAAIDVEYVNGWAPYLTHAFSHWPYEVKKKPYGYGSDVLIESESPLLGDVVPNVSISSWKAWGGLPQDVQPFERNLGWYFEPDHLSYEDQDEVLATFCSSMRLEHIRQIKLQGNVCSRMSEEQFAHVFQSADKLLELHISFYNNALIPTFLASDRLDQLHRLFISYYPPDRGTFLPTVLGDVKFEELRVLDLSMGMLWPGDVRALSREDRMPKLQELIFMPGDVEAMEILGLSPWSRRVRKLNLALSALGEQLPSEIFGAMFQDGMWEGLEELAITNKGELEEEVRHFEGHIFDDVPEGVAWENIKKLTCYDFESVDFLNSLIGVLEGGWLPALEELCLTFSEYFIESEEWRALSACIVRLIHSPCFEGVKQFTYHGDVNDDVALALKDSPYVRNLEKIELYFYHLTHYALSPVFESENLQDRAKDSLREFLKEELDWE